MLCNNREYSLIDSSHANNRRLHFHAAPSIPRPRPSIPPTVQSFSTAKSKRRGNFNLNGMSPIHLSYQNKVPRPCPITLLILSSNQFLTPSPTPSQIRHNIFHHTDESLPPSLIRPPTSPKRAFNTRYHRPPFSVNNLQHHLPNIEILKAPILLIANHPSSFGKQIESHLIQAIFLLTSQPPNLY